MISDQVHFIDGLWPWIHIGPAQISSYHVIISFSFCLALLWTVKRAEKRSLNHRTAVDAGICVMVSAFFGSRLFHVFFEDWNFYAAHPLEILEFWNGGFVFYGGAIAAFAGTWWFLRLRGERVADWCNLFAPVAALGYAIGRVGCFATGCCYGKNSEIGDFHFRHPTQLYAVFLELIILGALLYIEKNKSKSFKKIPGYLFVIWIALHAIARILMESFRADPRGPEFLDLSVSTWISFLILVADFAYVYQAQSRFQQRRNA